MHTYPKGWISSTDPIMKPNKIHKQAKDNQQIHICAGRLILFGRWWKASFIKSIIFGYVFDVTHVLTQCYKISCAFCITVINKRV